MSSPLEPVHALLRDAFYRLENKEYLPCTKVGRKVVVGEDSNGDDIVETHYSWEPKAGYTPEKAPSTNLKVIAYKELKERLADVLGSEEAAADYVRDFRKSVGRAVNVNFSASELASMGDAVRAMEAQKKADEAAAAAQ